MITEAANETAKAVFVDLGLMAHPVRSLTVTADAQCVRWTFIANRHLKFSPAGRATDKVYPEPTCENTQLHEVHQLVQERDENRRRWWHNGTAQRCLRLLLRSTGICSNTVSLIYQGKRTRISDSTLQTTMLLWQEYDTEG